MPRVKPLTGAEAKNRKLLAELAAQMAFHQKSRNDVARHLGMDASTLSRRKNDPGTFTLEELRRLKSLFPEMQISI